MKPKKRILITIFIAAVVGAIAWRIFFADPPKVTASGGPLDIKLIAIRPDMGDVCYDPTGKKLEGVTFPLMPVDYKGPCWRKGEYCIDFIFELPAGDEIILPYDFISIFDKDHQLYSRDFGFGSSPRQTHWQITHQGRRFLMVNYRFADHRFKRYNRFMYRKKLISHVDLNLSYYHPPSQKPDIVFKGPFKTGPLNRYDIVKGPYLIDDVTDAKGKTVANFTMRQSVPGQLFAYDKAGNLHTVFRTINSGDYFHSPSPLCYVRGVSILQLDSVFISKNSNIQTFENINVDFPGHERRYYAQFLDKMADRLGVEISDPRKFLRYKYSGWQEALKVLDVARGSSLFIACRDIYSDDIFDYSGLDEKTQAFIKKSLIDRFGTCDQVHVVCLGVVCNIAEFVDLAIDALEGEDIGYAGVNYGRHNTLVNISRIFKKHQINLNPAQLKRVKDVYQKITNKHVKEALKKYSDE